MSIISDLRQEKTASEYIPFTLHYTDSIIGTRDDDVVCTIHVQGAAHDTLSIDELNGIDTVWKAAIGSLAKGGHSALWTHFVRKKVSYDHRLQYTNYFSQNLADAYAAKLDEKEFYVNDIYVSPVYRASTNKVEGAANKINKQSAEEYKDSKLKGIQEVEAVASRLEQTLRRLSPNRLRTNIDDSGYEMSDPATFYGELINGRSVPIPARRGAVSYGIQLSELSFGNEVIEIAGTSSSKFVGMLGLKTPYSVETLRADILHPLFNAPIEFVLSQSLVFFATSEADKFLKVQLGQYESTQGTEILQNQISAMRMRLQAGQFSMCGHEFTLAIYGDSIADLNRNIQIAEAALIEKSIQVIRHSRGMLIAQYFGMLPGNFKTKRLASQPLSSDNFAAFFPLHNNMVGMAKGSQWGMPIAMVETPQGSPYFLNLHNSKKEAEEMGLDLGYEEEEEADPLQGRVMRKENGNTRYIGNAGDGKTVTQTFLRSLLQKTNTTNGPYTSYAFDNDLGQLIYINAIGGQYFEFRNGESTGINYFSMPDTPRNRDYILTQCKWCAKQDKTYVANAEDERELRNAIANVYTQTQPEKRRFARILDTLTAMTPLHSALKNWCGDGPTGWILDSSKDRFNLEKFRAFGFDMTDFLSNESARTPILSYLFYKINSNRDGKPYSVDIDEAGIALSDPELQEQIAKEARTIRKKNGIITLATQNPLDLSSQKLEGTLVNQLPSAFYFPNPTAKWEEYAALGLTLREFELVHSKMTGAPGTVLFKKGNKSTVIRIDLTGMNDYLAVLSGSYDNVAIYRDVRREVGEDAPPEVWLPLFYSRRL